MQSSDKIIVFSLPTADRLASNYIDKLAIFVLAAAGAIQLVFFPDPNIRPTTWLYLLLFMLIIAVIMEFGFRRVAHKISVDREKGLIVFELLRGAGTTKTDIAKLEAIQVGFYIAFQFDGRKVFYNNVTNKELISFLETLKPILWRRMGRFLYKHW